MSKAMQGLAFFKKYIADKAKRQTARMQNSLA